MTCTIDATTRHQEIIGWGATHSVAPSPYTATYSAQADFLWGPSGLWLPMYNGILVVDTNGSGWPEYLNNQTASQVHIIGDFSQELAAQKRGCKAIMARCWAAQSVIVQNGSIGSYTWQAGGTMNGAYNAGNYSNLANAFTTHASNALAAGVYMTHYSYANEIDIASPGYPQANWTNAQLIAFHKVLQPAFVTWGQNNPSYQAATGRPYPYLIGGGETANWQNSAGVIGAYEGDATALAQTDYYATHQYFGNTAFAPPNPCSRQILATEYFVQGNAFASGVAEAMLEMTPIFAALTTGNASACLYWEAEDIGDNDNSGLTGANTDDSTGSSALWDGPTLKKTAYFFGHYSRYVRPGAIRIDVPSAGMPAGVNVTAFLQPYNWVIVCQNTNASSTAINFSLNGMTVVQATQIVSDASNNWTQQGTIAVSGGAFSATLNASSMTTFVCVPNVPSPAPAHRAILTASGAAG